MAVSIGKRGESYSTRKWVKVDGDLFNLSTYRLCNGFWICNCRMERPLSVGKTEKWLHNRKKITLFACFVACVQQNPQIHIWCATCWPIGGQHDSQTFPSNPQLEILNYTDMGNNKVVYLTTQHSRRMPPTWKLYVFQFQLPPLDVTTCGIKTPCH